MLIFDFDGVIINSLDEITVTAHNVVTGRLDTSLNALSPGVIRLFQRNRFHVQGIGDVVTLMKWCKDNESGGSDNIYVTCSRQQDSEHYPGKFLIVVDVVVS